jgi:hypothetical protein
MEACANGTATLREFLPEINERTHPGYNQISAKKLVISMERVTFVGHEVDSQGLNMTEPRISRFHSRRQRH